MTCRQPVRPTSGCDHIHRTMLTTGGLAGMIEDDTARGAIACCGSYRPYEMVTDAGSQGKLVSERSRPGSARSAFQAAQAASTTAS